MAAVAIMATLEPFGWTPALAAGRHITVHLAGAAGLPTTYWRNARSGDCLDQDYSNRVAHSDVLAWRPCTRGWNELWQARPNNDFTYTFVNVASGDCLDQDFSNGAPHPDVLAWPCNGQTNQEWSTICATTIDCHYRVFENFRTSELDPGQPTCLDQDYSGGVAHRDVLAWPCNASSNQIWYYQ